MWKALFGEVLPQALNIFPAGNPSHTALPLAPFSDATEQQLAAFKATAWRTSTSILLPQQAGEGGRRHKTAQDITTEAEGGDRLRLIAQQLLRMLESASSATVCGGARALRCIAEARAHAVHAAGEEYSEDPRITDLLMVRPQIPRPPNYPCNSKTVFPVDVRVLVDGSVRPVRSSLSLDSSLVKSAELLLCQLS